MNYPNSRADCIKRSSETKDGIYIAGHSYENLIAFQDQTTKRWYMVDTCMDCGTPTASFTEQDQFIADAKTYPNVLMIGGPRDPGEFA